MVLLVSSFAWFACYINFWIGNTERICENMFTKFSSIKLTKLLQFEKVNSVFSDAEMSSFLIRSVIHQGCCRDRDYLEQ